MRGLEYSSRPLHLVAGGALSHEGMPGNVLPSVPGAPVLVPPQPKTDSVTMAEYIEYFETVARANSWYDATQARIFPALLGVGNKALSDCPEGDLLSFTRIKGFLTRVCEPYRDAYMLDLLRASMQSGETVEHFRDRIVSLVEQVYPRFAAANKALLSRDFFVCGLKEPLQSAVLNAGTSRKLEDVVNTALMCQSLRGRLSHAGPAVSAAGSSRRGAFPAAPAGGGLGSAGPRPAGPVCWGCGGRGHVIARCSRTQGARPRQVEGLSARPPDGRLYLDPEIDGQRIQLLVDSGATVSCLPAMFSPQEAAQEQCITAANGTELEVYGMYRGSVRLEDQVEQHAFFVTDVRQGVMGMDLLQKFGALIDVQHREVRPAGSKRLPSSGGGEKQQFHGCPTAGGGATSQHAGLLTAAAPTDSEPELVTDEDFSNFAQIALISAEDLMSECDSGDTPVHGPSEHLDELLGEFNDVFSGLGRTQLIEHRIVTTTASSV